MILGRHWGPLVRRDLFAATLATVDARVWRRVSWAGDRVEGLVIARVQLLRILVQGHVTPQEGETIESTMIGAPRLTSASDPGTLENVAEKQRPTKRDRQHQNSLGRGAPQALQPSPRARQQSSER